jgi:hypothetical protein
VCARACARLFSNLTSTNSFVVRRMYAEWWRKGEGRCVMWTLCVLQHLSSLARVVATAPEEIRTNRQAATMPIALAQQLNRWFAHALLYGCSAVQSALGQEHIRASCPCTLETPTSTSTYVPELRSISRVFPVTNLGRQTTYVPAALGSASFQHSTHNGSAQASASCLRRGYSVRCMTMYMRCGLERKILNATSCSNE